LKLPAWIARLVSGPESAGAEAAGRFARGAERERQGDLEGALEHYREALDLRPDFFEAARALGVVWNLLGDAAQAEHFTRMALALNPAAGEMHLHLGDLLRTQGRAEEALASCREAIRLHPQSAQAQNNLANTLKDLGRLGEADAAYRAALRLEPNLVEANFNLGVLLHEGNALSEAEAPYRKAVEANAAFLQGWLNLATLYEQRGEVRAALECYRRAIAIEPERADLHVNQALHLLATGELNAGWREYEWRWRLPDMAAWSPRFSQPRWEGEPLGGKTILVWCEQGLGDAIHFVRYVPMLAERGAKVVLRCPSALRALFKDMSGVSVLIGEQEQPPSFDLQCALLSLPRVFGTTLENVPGVVPYLRADPLKVRRWGERLPAGRKVGLVWATDSSTGAAKNLQFQVLAPLTAVPGIAFVSLQRGPVAAQAPATIVDAGRELGDFSDTAALIANLDLVICIDTAVAHLAGALGKPAWVLLSLCPDWRWLLDRDDSPWYPTLRLFRQREPGDWSAPVREIETQLSAFRKTKPQ